MKTEVLVDNHFIIISQNIVSWLKWNMIKSYIFFNNTNTVDFNIAFKQMYMVP